MSEILKILSKKLEVERNKNLALRNALKKIQDPQMWKVGRISGADQYQGMPPACRYIDEALQRVEALEIELREFLLVHKPTPTKKESESKLTADRQILLDALEEIELLTLGLLPRGPKIAREAIAKVTR